eukprot:scaffold24495_cov111-Isochrysis_galbana.AAC.6
MKRVLPPTDRDQSSRARRDASATIIAELCQLFGLDAPPTAGAPCPLTARVSGGIVQAASLELLDLDPADQRGRGPADARLRYEWRLEVEPPHGSPYGGRPYRFVLRFPVGYPLHAPRLQALSILYHAEIELRDPYEGQFDYTFYDALSARAAHAAAAVGSAGAGSSPTGPAAISGSDEGGAGSGGPVVGDPDTGGGGGVVGGEAGRLRFGVGDRVQCNVGVWRDGSVVALAYSQPGWPPSKIAPYQIALDDGRLVYAPADHPRLIRAPPAHGLFGGGGAAGEQPIHFTVLGLLALLMESFCGPVWPAHNSFQQAAAAVERAAAPGAAAPWEPGEGGEEDMSTEDEAAGEEGAAVTEGSPEGGEAAGTAGTAEMEEATAGGSEGGRAPVTGAGLAAQSASAAAVQPGSDGYRSDGYRSDGYTVTLWRKLAARHARGRRHALKYSRGLALHPDLFDLSRGFRPEWLAPAVLKAMEAWQGGAAAAADVREAAVRNLVTEVSPGVFTFDLLSASFCELLISELERYEASGMPPMRPNSMNNYGIVLNGPIGLERLMDLLQSSVVAPIGEALFGEEGQGLDHHHAFVVQYRPAQDKGLDMHTDACDVTLNVCLGKEFTGGGLTLCGLRGGGEVGGGERKLRLVHSHRKGQAILHLGRHRHGADDILTGERLNLILWNKSSRHRLSRGFLSKYKTRPPAAGTDSSPDLVCLSYTHDDDFEDYKPYPLGWKPVAAQAGG